MKTLFSWKEEPITLLIFNKGDVVDARYGHRWIRCVITWVTKSSTDGAIQRVLVRRLGLAKDGRPYPVVDRSPYPRDVRLVRRFDPTTANVYADWLEERDQPMAAQMLRKAFPLEDGK